jgi:hypothetical protein
MTQAPNFVWQTVDFPAATKGFTYMLIMNPLLSGSGSVGDSGDNTKDSRLGNICAVLAVQAKQRGCCKAEAPCPVRRGAPGVGQQAGAGPGVAISGKGCPLCLGTWDPRADAAPTASRKTGSQQIHTQRFRPFLQVNGQKWMQMPCRDVFSRASTGG